MEIINIKGRSSYIKGGTNTGVYLFEDNKALLIDAGHTVHRGHRLGKFFEDQGILPQYMYSTHEHFDHFEAYEGLKSSFENIQLLAHKNAKPYIENLYLGMAYLSSSAIPKFFGRRNNGLGKDLLQVNRFYVDLPLDKEFVAHGHRFEIHHVPGHCPGQAVIITPDRVCYLGDAVVDQRIIDKYDMPFLFSVELQIQSLHKLKKLDYEFGVIGHSKRVYTKNEIDEIIDSNLQVIDRYEQSIANLLQMPMTREEILANLMVQNQIDCSYPTYHYNNSTAGAFIAKLSNENRLDYFYKDGKIYYRLSEG